MEPGLDPIHRYAPCEDSHHVTPAYIDNGVLPGGGVAELALQSLIKVEEKPAARGSPLSNSVLESEAIKRRVQLFDRETEASSEMLKKIYNRIAKIRESVSQTYGD